MKLDVTFPFTDLEDFKKFDVDVKESKSKKEALMVLLRVLIYGQTTARGCICKMASALLTKSVESHYSGTGKIIKGFAKLNFSSTETYKCMRDVVTEKFGDSEECTNFAG
ncbi:uncharacterized protein LOC141526542 [Cotesia typhae]|uniref:uncharacterized protein LOC141526542 n=1 Tax=Cotesia typhae TaxID=2053667 RepID=UPI003D6928AE